MKNFLLRAPKFHLITFSDGADVSELGEYAHLFDHQVVPLNADVIGAFGTEEPFQLLLRPDNYIGLTSADMSLRSVADYFRELFG